MTDYDDRAHAEASVRLLFGSIREAMTDGTSFDQAFRKRLADVPPADLVQTIFDVAVLAAGTIQGHCEVVGGDSQPARMYQLRQFELTWQHAHDLGDDDDGTT